MTRKPARVFFLRRLLRVSAPIKEKTRKTYTKIKAFAQTKPLTSFLILLIILLISLSAGRFLQKPKEVIKPEPQAKEVTIFKIGTGPRITLQARVNKSQVLEIVAQTPAVVSQIHVNEGQVINKGKILATLSSNYSGGNTASVQKQIASANLQNVKENFDNQTEIITKQREIAKQTDSNSDDLRDILNKSLDETRSLIALNEDILKSINLSIADLEATNTGGINDAQILQAKQSKSQFEAANIQAKSALRQAELQTPSDKPQAQISNLGREVAEKQLSIQESQLLQSLETATLQLKLAQVQESIMFPSVPFKAKIERIHVAIGETLLPGTPIATISGINNVTHFVALVPATFAHSISKLEPSFLTLEEEKVELVLNNISQEATNGQLYTVEFIPSQRIDATLTKNAYVEIDVPIAAVDTTFLFVPLDSIHQTHEETIVYVLENQKAKGKEVELGKIQGAFVEVTSGLNFDDEVIVDRIVTEGDHVTTKNN